MQNKILVGSNRKGRGRRVHKEGRSLNEHQSRKKINNTPKVQTVTTVEFLLFLILVSLHCKRKEVFVYCDFTPLKRA